LQRQDTGDAQAIHTYRQIVQTVVWVAEGAIALHTLGIDLTHIFTAGGLFDFLRILANSLLKQAFWGDSRLFQTDSARRKLVDGIVQGLQ
jgi:hypothetical protein